MDKIARLRQKIKELRELLDNHNYYLDNSEQALGYSAALDDIEKFLDTLLEEDALPCWKKVHTYTEELREGDMEKMLLDLSVGKGKRESKIALPDKVVDTLSEEPDKSLEEAAEQAYPSTTWKEGKIAEHITNLHCQKAFIAGAEWQKEHLKQQSDE